MNTASLKLKLLKKFSRLNDAHIVSYSYDYAILKKKLGRQAAALFEELIIKYDDPRIGIGGGSTIYSMIDSLKKGSRRIKIFPTALVGRGPEVTHIDSTFLAKLLYFKARPEAKAFVINIPPLPQNNDLAKTFLQFLTENIYELRWLIDEMSKVDIAFVGLGAVIPTGDIEDEMNKLGVTLKTLKESGVVGGINYNWFKNDGSQYGNYFLTVPIEKLVELSARKDKHIVLVAGGKHKTAAIDTAISVGMANTLITDSLTAQQLLELA